MRKTKRFVSLLLTLAMMLSVCSVLSISTGAAVHTFYVSSTGSDSNDGSESAPFKTVEKAHQAIAAAFGNGDSAHLVFQDDSYFHLSGVGANGTAPESLTPAQQSAAEAAYPGVVFIGDSILAGVTSTDKVNTGKTYHAPNDPSFLNPPLEFGYLVQSNIFLNSSTSGFDGRRVNLAVGGENSATVVSRMNTDDYPSVFKGAFTVPAEAGGSVAVTVGQKGTGYAVSPLRQSNSGGYLETQSVTIHVGNDSADYIKGTLSYSGGSYLFTRTSAGDAVEVPADTVFYYDVTEQVSARGLIPIVMIGNNEGVDINAQMHLNFIDAILQKFGVTDLVNDKYIVVSPYLCALTDGDSAIAVESEKRIESAMVGRYGNHVVNIREFMSTMGVYEIDKNGSAFDMESHLTAADYQRMAAGNIPEALLAAKAGTDRYIHLASYSAEMMTKLIYSRMDTLGYFDELKAAVNLHEDHLVHVDAKAATCQNGNREYWYSTDTGALYSDAKGTTETTLSAILVAGSDAGHNYVNGTCTYCGAAQSTVSPAGNLNVAYVFDNQNNEFRDKPGAYIDGVSGNTLPSTKNYKTNTSGQPIYGSKESTAPQCVTRDQVAASAVKATQANPLEDVMTEMGLYAARGMLLDVKGTNTLDNTTCLTLLPQGTATKTITSTNTCTVTANTPYLVYKISTGDASKVLNSFNVTIRTINCNAMRIGAFLTKEAPSYNANGYVDYSASGAVPFGYFEGPGAGYNNNEKPIVLEATSAAFTGDLANVNEVYLVLAFNNYGKAANATGDRKSGYGTNDVMIESIKFSSTTEDIIPTSVSEVAYVFDNQNNEFRDKPGAYINRVSGNDVPSTKAYKTNSSGQPIYGSKESTTPQCVTRDQVAASAVKATQANPLEDVMTEMGLYAARGMLLDVKGTNTLDNATCLTLLPQGTSNYTITNANTCTVTADTPYLVYKISTGGASKVLDSFTVTIRTINCNAMRIGAFLTKDAPSYNASGYVDYSASGAVPFGYFVGPGEGYNNNEKSIEFKATSADFTGDLANVNEVYLVLAFNNYGKAANATGDRKSGYSTNDVMIESIKLTSTIKDTAPAPVSEGHIHTPVLHAYQAATCSSAGNILYFTCSGTECAGKYYSDVSCTTEISASATVIPQLAHQYLNGYAADADGHWQTCILCDTSTEPEAHTPGAPATCTSSQICTVCGYGIMGPQHTLEPFAEHSATCVSAGNKAYWHCTACDKYYSDEDCIFETTVDAMTIPATGIHTPAGDYLSSEAGHWQLCSECHEPCALQPHTPNIPAATETESQVCTACGYVMAAATGCPHSGVVSQAAVAPTCKTNGSSAYWYCPDCGIYFADVELTEIITVSTTIEAAVSIPAYGITGTLGHDYDENGQCRICGRYQHAWRFGNNIALEDNILLRYYVVFDDVMTAWMQDGELTVDLHVDVKSGTPRDAHYESNEISRLLLKAQDYTPTGEVFDCYVFSIPTMAKQMCDAITLTIKHGDDVVFTYSYSVQKYCINKSNSSIRNLPELVKSIVDYGAAAQLYKDYDVEHLANDHEAFRN